MKDFSLKAPDKPPTVSSELRLLLEQLSEQELIDLRHELDSRLMLDLGALNLAEELAIQFRQGKNLLNEVQGDKDVPANQKAQILNSVRAMLSEIIKQQTDVYSMERLKKYEVAFVKCVKLLTLESREAFFDLYGEFLEDIAVAPEAGNGAT